jgi:hypothetical protein
VSLLGFDLPTLAQLGVLALQGLPADTMRLAISALLLGQRRRAAAGAVRRAAGHRRRCRAFRMVSKPAATSGWVGPGQKPNSTPA